MRGPFIPTVWALGHRPRLLTQHSHGERFTSRATNSNDLHRQHLRSPMQGHPFRAEPHHAVSSIALSTPNNQSTATPWRTQRSHLKTYTHLIQADRQPCSASANPSSSIASRTPTTELWLLLPEHKAFWLVPPDPCKTYICRTIASRICARPGYSQRWVGLARWNTNTAKQMLWVILLSSSVRNQWICTWCVCSQVLQANVSTHMLMVSAAVRPLRTTHCLESFSGYTTLVFTAIPPHWTFSDPSLSLVAS